MQLQLETIAHCQAACVFCPYPTMQRAKGIMPWELFKKIVDEAIGIARIDHYTLTGLGEPLIDPHIVPRVRYIRQLLPSVMIDLYTNGSLLTPRKACELRDAGVTTIYVSLNAVTASQRRQSMHLDDFDQVCRALDTAMVMLQGSGTRIVVKAVCEKDLLEAGDADVFIERWGGRWDQGGNAFLHQEGNWAGAMRPVRVLPTQACGRALDEIMVLWDGRVSLCCFDGEGAVTFGDLNTQSLKEIYSSERALAYREAHVAGRRQELALCATCTSI